MAHVMLPPEICTPEQLGHVVGELRAHLGKLQDRSARVKVTGRDEPMPLLSKTAVTILGVNSLRPDSPQLEKFAQTLQDLRDNAPVAHFVLAESPDSSVRQQLTDWFRQNVRSDSLVTFAARSDIGGGFLLRAGSKQYDFTFRTQLLENKAAIGALLAAHTKAKA